MTYEPGDLVWVMDGMVWVAGVVIAVGAYVLGVELADGRKELVNITKVQGRTGNAFVVTTSHPRP